MSGNSVNCTVSTDARISVIVCVYTERRLDSLRALCRRLWEEIGECDEVIIVVDHNSGLYEVLTDEFAGQARVVENNGAPGLSDSRNTGVAHVRNAIIVFIDDDAVPRVGAMAAVRECFADSSVHGVGGAVYPLWEGGSPPLWFPPEFGWVVGCDYVGLPPDGAQIRNPIGAAMAVRSSSLLQAGLFSVDLGRVGAVPAGCEETLMGIRLRSAVPGSRIVRSTGFAVDHLVPEGRQTIGYFLSRCFHEGRSKAQLSDIAGAAAGLSSERTYATKTLPAGVAAGVMRLVS